MKPGRELDALVAEKVMNFALGMMSEQDVEPSIIVDQAVASFDVIPYYSTDISAAWEVVEKLAGRFVPSLTLGPTNEWQAVFQESTDVIYYEHSNSAPHAICLAALKAVGVNIEKA